MLGVRRWRELVAGRKKWTKKTTTKIHTRQLQKYTQDNYNNTHKTTNNNKPRTTIKIHTRQLTTIHTRHTLYTKGANYHAVDTTAPPSFTFALTL